MAVDLANGLRARGHTVTIFGRPGSELGKRYDILPVLGPADLSPVSIFRALAALQRLKADVVLTVKDKDLRQTGVAARLLKIPVMVLHGTDRPLKKTFRYRFFFKHIATHHVANSEATKKTLIESAPYLKEKAIPVIYNGIAVDAFADADPAALPIVSSLEPSVAGPPVTVGFVGHFEFRKGILDFAEAWKQVADQIPHAQAVIVGSGRREADFRIALENAPRVHWLGFRPDIAGIFRALDVFVMPSHFEGFGLVLAEAMAARTACVVYDASSLPELITNEKTGLLVPLKDVHALGAAIVRICNDSALRDRLADAAAHEARVRFSIDKMVADYEQLLLEIQAIASTAA